MLILFSLLFIIISSLFYFFYVSLFISSTNTFGLSRSYRYYLVILLFIGYMFLLYMLSLSFKTSDSIVYVYEKYQLEDSLIYDDDLVDYDACPSFEVFYEYYEKMLEEFNEEFN